MIHEIEEKSVLSLRTYGFHSVENSVVVGRSGCNLSSDLIAYSTVAVPVNGSYFYAEQVFRCEIACEYCIVERSSVCFFSPNLAYVGESCLVTEMCAGSGSENLVLIAVVAVG